MNSSAAALMAARSVKSTLRKKTNSFPVTFLAREGSQIRSPVTGAPIPGSLCIQRVRWRYALADCCMLVVGRDEIFVIDAKRNWCMLDLVFLVPKKKRKIRIQCSLSLSSIFRARTIHPSNLPGYSIQIANMIRSCLAAELH
jgi:hypothetical protein